MAYVRDHEWKKGQTITAEKLNHMEKGIAAALNAIYNAFGTDYTDGSDKYEVSLENLGTSKDISAGAIQGTTLKATGATSGNTLDITGTSVLKGNVTVGTTDTAVDTTINGKLVVKGKDDDSSPVVHEAATLTGTVNITGDTAVTGDMAVTGDTTLTGDVEIKQGDTTLNGKLTVKGNQGAEIQNSLNVNGTAYINNDFSHGKTQSQTQDGITIIHPHKIFNAHYKTINLGSKPQIISSNSGGSITNLTDYSSSVNISGHILTISNNTTDIQSPKTKIEGNVIIGPESSATTYTNTVLINANSFLKGTTNISKLYNLIVGDSTSTVDNEIYGFTTISDLTAGDLTVGTPTVESDSETQTYSGTATFNTSEIIFNQPASFFNNNVKTEHIEITSRSIKQSIGDQTYDLILQNGTDIYFGASNNNTFIRGNSVTIVENDLKFTMHNSTDTYTYRFADNGQAGFQLTANYDSSSSSPQPNHTLFHYIPSAFDDDMLIVGGLSNSVASTDTSLVQDVFINAKDSIILTTKNTTGIRINNDTAIVGTLKVIDTAISGVLTVNNIKTTVTDESTLDGRKDYKYNYTLLTSPTLGLLSLQCSGTDNLNQPLTKTPSLFSYRPYGFESESYLTIGGPTVLPPEGDNGCVEQTYIRAKDNITLSPTNSTGRVNVNSDLHIGYQKSLYINNTTLSEDDIKHLHTLWTNYGGE